MASYHSYNQSLGRDVSMEEMIEEGKYIFPCHWHKHTQRWLDNPHSAELIQVKYEDLHASPMEQISRICAFLAIERPDELLQRVVEGCSFRVMKERDQKYGRDNKEWPEHEEFIRRGVVGSYQDEIEPALVDTLERKAHQQLKQLGYL
jgi:hypothetical protein